MIRRKTLHVLVPSPTIFIYDLPKLNYTDYQVPHRSDQTDQLLYERQASLLNTTQQMHQEVRGVFKLIGKALKNVFGKKKK